MAKKNKSTAIGLPEFDEKKYQAESDVRMMKDMNELKKDKSRMKRAVKMASEMEKAAKKEAGTLSKIAKKKF